MEIPSVSLRSAWPTVPWSCLERGSQRPSFRRQCRDGSHPVLPVSPSAQRNSCRKKLKVSQDFLLSTYVLTLPVAASTFLPLRGIHDRIEIRMEARMTNTSGGTVRKPKSPPPEADRVVRTVCSPNCMGTCGVNAHVRNDRIIKLEPASFPDPGFERICLRGIAMATERLHHPDRISHPLIRAGERGANVWRQVSWDEAYDYILNRQQAIAERHGWRSNAWVSMTGNYAFRASTSARRMANVVGGTYFSKLGLTADSAAYMGMRAIFGVDYASNDISEVGQAKFLLSVGKNVVDTGHSEMHFLFDAMERGLKFTMVDPRFSRSAAKADEWLAPHPGTDVALALGMIHVVVSEGLIDEAYVVTHTNAPFLVREADGACLRDENGEYLVWDLAAAAPVPAGAAISPALRGSWTVSQRGEEIDCVTAFSLSWREWEAFTPQHAASICGVPPEQIASVAREYATTEPAWLWVGYGPQRYAQGHTVVRAWATLASLCGNIGKPHAGMNTNDGPLMLLLFSPTAEWVTPQGRVGHSLPGTRMVEAIASGEPYPVKSLWMSAYNFGTQSPLLKRFVREALPNLDLFVVSEQVMTDAAVYADVVLPCVSYYEDDWDVVGNIENWYVQLRRRAVPPVGESRNDVDIFGGVCDRLQLGHIWNVDPEQSCRDYLSNHTDPRIRAVDFEALKRDGVARVPVDRPYTPFRDQKFATPSGRIELYQEQFADLDEAVLKAKPQAESGQRDRFPFHLITYKHTHSTHSQHTILPMIAEVLPEPRLEIAPTDAARRNIADGDVVRVFNDRGHFVVKANVSNGVPPGTLAMPQGWWKRHFASGHPSDLGHIPESPVQTRIAETNYSVWDFMCDVEKEEQP
ncbi:molybdopterin-dependent oxidoreductase [Novosphingobium sp. JCM 18896]|uniref:molybdopterin-containing oxidoreductase family protein n=1 Tax=Novosphingobium sp. JCM 18896 TaxID=2989731 RepID=UPI0022229535|nr:molybdopterin-dependent oxidoreductase [Novosphingobium sp. JCM 18896]MCW1432306.1 molybdopterin-dependent oxidoreductase [Novosphingobium sp. JCM 18896]